VIPVALETTISHAGDAWAAFPFKLRLASRSSKDYRRAGFPFGRVDEFILERKQTFFDAIVCAVLWVGRGVKSGQGHGPLHVCFELMLKRVTESTQHSMASYRLSL